MNVITVASRKGGAGKSTLTAHLAAHGQSLGKRCLIIDADPQGSLSLWHSMRTGGEPALVNAARGIDGPLALAMVEGYKWVFIDTAPTMWVVVQEAIRAATMVLIPARPGFFDLAAVRETVKVARERNKPYAVVINAAPVKRDEKESPVVLQSRTHLDKLAIPVWAGQISQRAGFSLCLGAGLSAGEVDPECAAASEITRLWTAIERAVDAVNAAQGPVKVATATGAGGEAAPGSAPPQAA